MGFFDSFKTGLSNFSSGVGDFIGDLSGLAVGLAPTIIPLLQSTGVIPQVQPGGGVSPGQPQFPRRGPVFGPVAFPGGAPVPQRVPNPFPTNPVGFPTGAPTHLPTAPSGVTDMSAFQSNRPGFAPAAFNLPSTGGLDLPFIDIVGQGGGGQLARLTSPFVPTMAGARAQPFIASNPVTGATTWFKPAGKPILWSGDLTACRRVGKIARRARTVSRKR